MIVEHVLLTVAPERAAAFEAALNGALPLISASPGFLGLKLLPAAEQSGRYLLLVRWVDIAAHRDGFRRSARYEEWRAALHGFYDGLPTVTYFKEALVDV